MLLLPLLLPLLFPLQPLLQALLQVLLVGWFGPWLLFLGWWRSAILSKCGRDNERKNKKGKLGYGDNFSVRRVGVA